MKKFIFPILGIAVLCTNSSLGQNISYSGNRPDGHAPISVMGDHYHSKGGVMISYRYMPMSMEGTLSGTNSISDSEIFKGHMGSPKNMTMNMHMIGLMYAPLNKLTLSIMSNYLSNEMDLETKMGHKFTTSSNGFGDISATALVKIFNKNRQSLHGNFGVSIPLGKIDARDDMPAGENMPLAYSMQIGSGTIDPKLSLTYVGQTNQLSWGVQPNYTFRLGKNDYDYSFGNVFSSAIWGAIKATDFLSFSGALYFSSIDGIEGFRSGLNPMMMPLFNTSNSGRKQLDLGLGTNIYVPAGKFKNLRLAAEVKLPIYQNVNGIQMKNILTATLGLQYALGH